MRSIVLLLLILLAVSSAFAQGWEWQNTLIQGNNLACITFSPDGQHGWATSEGGDVLASADHGESWSVLSGATGMDLQHIVFADSMNGWGVGPGFMYILHSSDGGLSWGIQYWFGSNGWVKDVNFLDSNTGWAVSGHEIIHTTDGGESWASQANYPGDMIYAVSFANAQEGWAAGNIMLQTTDGGTNWAIISENCPVDGQMKFFAGGRGWALHSDIYFDSSKVLRTTDGGLSWTPQMIGADTIHTVFAMDFLDDSTGWAVGIRGDILHTSDTGVTWTRQSSGTTANLRSVKVMSHTEACITGDGGLVLRTTDGGAQWSVQAGNAMTDGHDLTCVHFADTLNGWTAGTGGIVLRTTNGGSAWTRINAGCSFNFTHLAVIDPLTVWIAGESDTFPHTTDGGISWTPFVANHRRPGNYGTPMIAHVGADHLWILADSVYRSTDGGATWTEHDWESLTTLPYPTGFVFIDENNGWISSNGDQGGGSILHTSNGGVTWNQIYWGDDWLFGLTFLNADSGWMIPESGVILHTTDGGAGWTQLSQPPAWGGGELQFTDALNGWNNQQIGFIHTTDGGVTWEHLSSPCIDGQNSMHFPDAYHGWTVGGHGAILVYHGSPESAPRDDRAIQPNAYTLSAFPNPFNPTTILSFDVPRSSRVTLNVYDLTGRLVQSLADRVYPQGSFCVNFDGSSLASGIYFARLQGMSFSKMQRLVLLK